MTTQLNRLFVLALALLSVGAAQAAPARSVTRAEIDAAVKRGITFLLGRQKADGHFSDANTPALTALPLWAMVVAGEGFSPAATNAANFVLKSQQEDGGFYARRLPPPEGPRGGADVKRPPRPGADGKRPPAQKGGSGGPGGLSTYNTAVCLSALYESKLSPVKAILDARTFLASSQLTGDDTMAGGFGYNRGGRRYADLSNSTYAFDAMRRTEAAEDFRPADQKRADLDWERALAFVENLQSKEGETAGGAAYNERTPQAGTSTNATGRVHLRAYGSMSYAAVLSMCYARLSRGDVRVRNALDYCAKFWTVDENPGMGHQGLYYYYDIVSRALSAAGVDELTRPGGEKVVWRDALARKLLSLQREDGSWVNDNNRFWEADPVLVTSFAVLSLALCR